MTDEQIEKRKWLNRAFYAEKKLKALMHKYKCDKARAERVTAVYGGVDKGKSDSRQNGTEMLLALLADSKKEYDDYEQEYMSIRREIESKIKTLDPVTYSIFSYRYLDYLPMEKIAEEMDYSVESIYKKHKRGLEKLQ